MEIVSEIVLDAPPSAVWAELVAFRDYESWNPFTPTLAGRLEVGAPVELTVRLGRQTRTQRMRVSRVDTDRALCWDMPSPAPWLLRARRCQELEPAGDGRTRYRNTERVEGLISPLVSLLYGESIRDGLSALERALAQRLSRPADTA